MYFYIKRPKESRPAFSGNTRAVQSASAGPLPVTTDGETRRDQEEPQRAGEISRRVQRPKRIQEKPKTPRESSKSSTGTLAGFLL
jgi:hypothetical protein